MIDKCDLDRLFGGVYFYVYNIFIAYHDYSTICKELFD